MTILGVQRQLRELGRIRHGRKDPDKGYPMSIDTWRFTSPNPNLIDAAAEMFGGEREPWDEKKFQVTTDIRKLPVRVAPQVPAPEFKLYPGPQRTCDGSKAWVAHDGVMVESECLCDPADRECKPEVLLKFFIPDLPDLGVWVYTSTAYTALRELVPAVEMMAGSQVDLSLVIEWRETRAAAGAPMKKFTVATLQTSMSMRSLLEGSAGGGVLTEPISGPVTPALPPAEVVEVPSLLGGAVGELATEGGGISADIIPIGEGRRTPEEIAESVQEQAWVALLAEIEAAPEGTMEENEVALRSLFRRMEVTGLWGEADRTLHAVLAKDGLQHVGDMRAAELKDFCARAWAAAREAVANSED